MAKKRQSKESVRQNAKRREEEARQRRNGRIRLGAIIVVVIVAVAAAAYLLGAPGSDSCADGLDVGDPGPLADLAPAERENYYDRAPEMALDSGAQYEAVIQTEKGDICLNLYPEASPETVNNFVFLARQGYYDGTIFHRVMQDFMAQGGDPTGTGAGGPGYEFADETDNGFVFDRAGLLAMANRGANTNGSQFFITYVPTPHLNGAHTIFGEITGGEDVLNSLTLVQPGSSDTPQGDLIKRIAIVER
jgi:cyclophilin family peptidyl-prolyl cis-trans isomerase